MQLIILGSGTSVPLTYRASPGFLLLIDDQKILFDMGPGTMRQLARTGTSHTEIDRIFISHFHPDHTADLIHFLFLTRYESGPARKKCIITGPKGLKDFIERLKSVYPNWLEVPGDVMSVDELDIQNTDNRSYGNYNLITGPLTHTENSLAYRFSINQRKDIVFSGDTGFCEEMINLAKDCDLLILECALPEDRAEPGHLTPALAGKVANLAGAKKLVLVHFYPDVLKTDIARQCRKEYNGELILGRDLLEIKV